VASAYGETAKQRLALVARLTRWRAKLAGLDARGFLLAHAGHDFFEGPGDRLRAGPTLINVIRAAPIA